MRHRLREGLLALLRGYQRWVSPALPPSCRYTPTCSQYAMEALAQRGLLAGAALAAWRVLRCHPFVQGGYDPVPQRPLPRAPYAVPSKDRVQS